MSFSKYTIFAFDGDSKTINKVHQNHDPLIEAQRYVIENLNSFNAINNEISKSMSYNSNIVFEK